MLAGIKPNELVKKDLERVGIAYKIVAAWPKIDRRLRDVLASLVEMSKNQCKRPAGSLVVLFLKTLERAALQRVLLHVVDAPFDLPFVPGRARLRRQHDRSVVLTKTAELWIQFRVVPIGLDHSRLEVIRHERFRDSAEVTKRVLDAPDEVLGRLAKHRLAIALARVTQHDSQYMSPPPLAILADDRCARAEVNLSICASSPAATSMRRKGSGCTWFNLATYRRTL